MQNRQGLPIPSPPIASSSSSSTVTAATPPQTAHTKPIQKGTAKNTVKSLLKGVKVVMKPKSKPTASTNSSGTVVSALGGSASHANGTSSILSTSGSGSGTGSSRLQVDQSMYSQPSSPAAPATKPISKTTTPPPPISQKRKIQALGADYGSDDDSDEQEDQPALKKSVVDATKNDV
jgi:hypothetical protein